MSGAAVRKLKSKGAVISLVTTVALIAAIVATLLGTGFFSTAVATHDAAAWLWTATSGELSHVNGDTGRVDIRHELTDSQGHNVEVIQTDTQILLRDLETGKINAIDPATLQITGSAETPPGKGVNVALHDGKAFIVDSVQGVVRQVDAKTLTPVGEPLRFAAGLTEGVFDNEGLLWFAVPKEGTLVSVAPGADGGNPSVKNTVGVAEPSHQLMLSVLRGGVAVLDTTSAHLTTVYGEDIRDVDVPIKGVAIMPASSDSTIATITVTDGRRVFAVDGTNVKEYEVPGKGAELGAAQEWWGRIYVSDNATDKVYVFEKDGKLLDSIDIPAGDGPIEMQARDGHMFINAPFSKNALVIDENHQVKKVDKGVGGVLGADVPPEEKNKSEPPKDTKKQPGAPRNVRATPGNGSATLSWDAAPNNGSAVTKYVVEGALKTIEVSGEQQVLKIPGLDNGTTYKLTVYAVNGIGEGPKAKANPVVPTAAVPDAPASATAVAQKDGTVQITWPAADGQGNKITGYKVDSVGAGGASQPVGEVGAETTMIVPAGKLEYGTQYAFTVVAIAESGAASDPSPPSATVVPYTTPEAVTNLKAVTVSGSAGTVKATWAAPANNGRAITGYKVTATGQQPKTVTGLEATISGLNDGQTVQIEVVAINEAGEGKPATTTAQSVAKPTVSITGSSTSTKAVTVKFSANDGGGNLSCKATVGGKSNSGNCSSLTVSAPASSSLTVTVTVTNAAGSASAKKSVKTNTLKGTVNCNNYGTGDTATYCNDGVGVYPQASQTGTPNSNAKDGATKTAYCRVSGTTINAYNYNNGKKSAWWIKIGANDYIPFAWLNLNSGDNVDLLSTC